MKTAFERFETAHMLAMAGDTQLAFSMFEVVARHSETPAEAIPFVRGIQAFLQRDRAELATQAARLTGVRAQILEVFHACRYASYCEAFQRLVPRRQSDELAFLVFSRAESEGALQRVGAILKPIPSLG